MITREITFNETIILLILISSKFVGFLRTLKKAILLIRTNFILLRCRLFTATNQVKDQITKKMIFLNTRVIPIVINNRHINLHL